MIIVISITAAATVIIFILSGIIIIIFKGGDLAINRLNTGGLLSWLEFAYLYRVLMVHSDSFAAF